MKLYNANLSPFAARCRIQIYAKDLPVTLAEPPGGAGTDAYRAINPTGKVPCLEVDGVVIPESEVICEFLEDRFPQPSLRPADDLESRPRLQAWWNTVREDDAVKRVMGEMREALAARR
jgi:glutathione S-transferase